MNIELKKKIVESVFENIDEFQLMNRIIDEYKSYIYDGKGEYLIGGVEVVDFIDSIISAIRM